MEQVSNDSAIEPGPITGRLPADIERAKFSKALVSITTEEVSEDQGQAVLAAIYESSSYPPPHYLAEYEKIVPGLASKVMGWIEEESKFRRKEDQLQSSHKRAIETARAEHRAKLETRAIDLAEKSMGWGIFRANVGMFLAWPLVIGIVAAGTYLINQGHDTAGATLVVSTLGTVLGAFVLNRIAEQREQSAGTEDGERDDDS
jgi:uncharacterized membrane protein